MKAEIEDDLLHHGSLQTDAADRLDVERIVAPWVEDMNSIMQGRDDTFETQLTSV